jgi:hypothetical protein
VWRAAEDVYKLKWQTRNGAEYTMGRPEATACNAILTRLGAKKDSPKALARFEMIVDAYLDDPRDYYAGHPILRLKPDLDRFIVIVAKKLAGKDPSPTKPTNGVRRGSDCERDLSRKFGRPQARTVDLGSEVGSGVA